jgi:hypothetical protein
MKRPIDKVRDSGGMFTLPPDVGGIQEMCEIKGSLHMIGTKAIYRVQLADEIDPQRTNINLPNAHQQILPYGTELPYVRQTLMQARRLFKDKVLGSSFDHQAGIDLSFDAMKDLAVMHEMTKSLNDRLAKIAEDMKSMTVKGRSVHLPTLGDVRDLTEKFLQKADHVALDLFGVVKLFHGTEIPKGMFEGLHELMRQKLDKDDAFLDFLNAAVPFLKFVRNARNAMEHEDETKRVVVTNITLLPSGELNPPCIEIIHKETAQPSVPLQALMTHMADQLVVCFEVMLAQICNLNVKPFSGIPLGVIQYDDRMQKAYNCRFGYASRMGEQIIPFG